MEFEIPGMSSDFVSHTASDPFGPSDVDTVIWELQASDPTIAQWQTALEAAWNEWNADDTIHYRPFGPNTTEVDAHGQESTHLNSNNAVRNGFERLGGEAFKEFTTKGIPELERGAQRHGASVPGLSTPRRTVYTESLLRKR
jgi:hypothetical protein